MGIRLILDTNVWSYVADGGEAEALEALEDDLGLKVVIPPSNASGGAGDTA
jgi:predicted nucleic acid-binding protein